MPKVSKININLELLKVSKITSSKIYVFSQGEARNIKFGQQANIIERVPLGTPPQVVVMTLAHNYMQIYLSRVTKGLLLLNLGSKSNYVIEVDRGLLYWG